MRIPKVMGVVNATPDSFSDGGAYHPLKHAKQLMADGADVIDVGAESTRPNAKLISPEEEWKRLQPVLEGLRGQGVIISVDTRHAETAKKALAAGANWINDVCGLRDEAMIEAVRDSHCTVVVMHSLSVPVNPAETLPQDTRIVPHFARWAEATLKRLGDAAISPARVILDPGVGFGLSPHQSMEVLAHMHELRTVHESWLVGHSRKSFMKLFSDAPADQRDPITRALSMMLAEQGVEYLRVHDVKGHKALWA